MLLVQSLEMWRTETQLKHESESNSMAWNRWKWNEIFTSLQVKLRRLNLNMKILINTASSASPWLTKNLIVPPKPSPPHAMQTLVLWTSLKGIPLLSLKKGNINIRRDSWQRLMIQLNLRHTINSSGLNALTPSEGEKDGWRKIPPLSKLKGRTSILCPIREVYTLEWIVLNHTARNTDADLPLGMWDLPLLLHYQSTRGSGGSTRRLRNQNSVSPAQESASRSNNYPKGLSSSRPHPLSAERMERPLQSQSHDQSPSARVPANERLSTPSIHPQTQGISPGERIPAKKRMSLPSNGKLPSNGNRGNQRQALSSVSSRLQDIKIQYLEDTMQPFPFNINSKAVGSRPPGTLASQENASCIRSLNEDRVHVSMRIGPLPTGEAVEDLPSLRPATRSVTRSRTTSTKNNKKKRLSSTGS